MIQVITGLHKHESHRHIFRKFRIITLTSLYILEVLCFIKKCKCHLKQNCGIHGHNTRNKWDLHTLYCSTVLYKRCVINIVLNYLINYQYKSNNWTIINVLREK